MLYIIFGKDPFARREAYDKLRADLDIDGSLSTNSVTFEAKGASPQEVMAACDTLPFLGDGRLVVLEGALATAARFKRPTNSRSKKAAPPPPSEPTEPVDDGDEPKEEEADPGRWIVLEEYVPRMPPTTTLVLLDADAGKANPLLMSLGKLGEVIECSPPAERDLPAWVTARARKIGLKIDAAAAKLLAELVGQDVYMLASELDKLQAYSGGDVVRDKDVRTMVSRAKEHKSWDLTDAILDSKGAQAARVLNEMLEDGSPTQQLIGMIAGRLRRAAIVRDMLDHGASGSAIAAQIRMKLGYGVERAIEQAQRHSLPAIRAAYLRLIEADLDVKRGLMEDDRLALELAVQELASKPATAARR